MSKQSWISFCRSNVKASGTTDEARLPTKRKPYRCLRTRHGGDCVRCWTLKNERLRTRHEWIIHIPCVAQAPVVIRHPLRTVLDFLTHLANDAVPNNALREGAQFERVDCELLFKAKWIFDHGEDPSSIYVLVSDDAGGTKPKISTTSGNPISVGLLSLAKKLVEDKASGVEQGCYANILSLVEIRDNAAHFLNKDQYLTRRVLEIGTASLKNYLLLATEWFHLDLSQYNFFLMPLSFFHGFEAAEPATRAIYPEQIQKLLSYLDKLDESEDDANTTQHVAIKIRSSFVRAKDPTAFAFRMSSNPDDPAMNLREEEFLENWPMIYKQLVDKLQNRYSDFMVNKRFQNILRPLRNDPKLSMERLLDPTNPMGTKQRRYSTNILKEFDKHYTRRSKAALPAKPKLPDIAEAAS